MHVLELNLDPLGSWAVIISGLAAIAFFIHRLAGNEDS